MKREFLVENTKALNKYLQKNSLSRKVYKYKGKNSYIYEFIGFSYIFEEYKSLKKIILISNKDIKLHKSIKPLKEVTGDIRYSTKYLTLFGNPKKYEFDIKKVFKKCDSVGLNKMDLKFEMGMSLSKVFRVILYRLSQFYFANPTETKKLKKAYKLAKKVFDKSVVENLEDSLSLPEIYDLNFKAFIQEENFFETNLSGQAVYFFEEKEKLFELVRK